MKGGQLPIIKQIAEFDDIQSMKRFEIEYITKYKEKYKLINQTKGGDYLGFKAHSRESILKKEATRAVDQYNVLGEYIGSYEIMEDIGRALHLKEKGCSHITQCCKGTRRHAYGYIWRYKGDPLGDISDINPRSLYFNKLVQYDLEGNRIAEYDSYQEASKAIGDHSKGGNIASVIKGDQKSCKGFIFQIEPIFVYFDHELYINSINTFKTDGKKITTKGKTIEQLNLKGKVVATYNSLSAASIAMIGTPNGRPSIRRCCENSGRKNTYKGYMWRYKAS